MEQQTFNNMPSRHTQIEKTVNFQQLAKKCRSKWYWFVISIAVCVAAGWLYYKSTIPLYEREVQVLVVQNEDSSNSQITASLSSLGGMFDQKPNSWTELVVITNPSVMIDVTKRLALNVNYTTPGKWHPVILYGSTLPVVVEFPGLDQNATAWLDGEVLPGNKFRITEFGYTSAENGTLTTGKIDKIIRYVPSETLQTSIGQVKVMTNPLYSGKAIVEPMQINVSHSGLYNTAMALRGRVNGTLHAQADNVILLKFIDSNVQRANDILNTIISVYNENTVKERAKTAESTTRFINDRLSIIEQELGSVESDISSYKSAHMLPDISAASSMYLQQADRAGTTLRDLSTRLAMTRYVRDFMTTASNSNAVLPANTGVADVNIEGQIAEYNRTLMERNSLAANSSASNPLVVDLDNRLEGYRRALIQSLDNQITALNTSISSVQRSEDISTGKVAATPGQARYLLSVERQQKVKESLYIFLLQKREENELAQAFVNSKIHVISQPTGSPVPISPVRNKLLLIGLIAGVLIPLGVIFVRETLDNKVRNRKDLEGLTIPFIGEIPRNPQPYGIKTRRELFHKTGEKSQGIVVEKDNLNMINEAFRVLRTSLQIAARPNSGDGGSVIAVTSANPGSGKTFVTMNLCAALAIKGHRVLMIDMDLRRASMSHILSRVDTAPGFVNYIVNSREYNDNFDVLIQKDINDIDNLNLLPVGTMPPNPAELLADPIVASMMADLRKEYDYIFLDCPPAEIVADAQIVNEVADMTLFVVRAGLFNRSALKTLQSFYDDKRYRNLSLVLNAAQTHDDGYGYAGHYYYRKRGYKLAKNK